MLAPSLWEDSNGTIQPIAGGLEGSYLSQGY